jgi:hypothetical protein
MMVQVQDRVCTERGVLQRTAATVGRDIMEAPVWGIDCYTRRMIELVISDALQLEDQNQSNLVGEFIERKILPAINAQSPEKAHNLKYALQHLSEVSYTVLCYI